MHTLMITTVYKNPTGVKLVRINSTMVKTINTTRMPNNIQNSNINDFFPYTISYHILVLKRLFLLRVIILEGETIFSL